MTGAHFSSERHAQPGVGLQGVTVAEIVRSCPAAGFGVKRQAATQHDVGAKAQLAQETPPRSEMNIAGRPYPRSAIHIAPVDAACGRAIMLPVFLCEGDRPVYF